MTNQITQAVLFDLDGTLLDTAHDLALALYALMDNHKLPYSKNLSNEIRAAAGKGCKGLIKMGLNIETHDKRYAPLVKQLLDHYEKNLLTNTQLFPGMEQVLTFLDKKNIPWGIVTNKPQKYTQLILDGLQITSRAKCIISGDTFKNCKPHPEPILQACEQLKIQANQCIYIGDSYIDVIASKAANMPVLIALYGYISELDDPKQWNADGYISQPQDIIKFLE